MKATLSATNHVVSADEELAGVLGTPAASVLNRPVLELVWPEDREMVAEKLASGAKQIVCALRHSSGLRSIPVKISANGLDLNIVLRDTKGKKSKPSPAVSQVGEPDNEEEEDAAEDSRSPGERISSEED